MRRVGGLWPSVVDPANLWLASCLARRGKRYKEATLRFDHDLEDELVNLRVELQARTWRPGPYHVFEIFEPKRRLISAAPYRDRVVHHALCNVIQPVFERTFVQESYANRVGLGTHRALRRFTDCLRRSRFVLLCDVRKFFPSMDHEVLKDLLRRKLKCRDTLWLVDEIVDGSNEQESVGPPTTRRHGLPIGNLTSQFFANVYLNPLDHFVKQVLGLDRYVRFVDDFAVFDDERPRLEEARARIQSFLEGLRVQLHPAKTELRECRLGAPFVGFVVHQDRIRVRSDSLRRARRRLRVMQGDYAEGSLTPAKVSERIQSWIAHLAHGDTWRLRERIFGDLAFRRAGHHDALEGPMRGGHDRVLRGGSWNNNAKNSRAANRNDNTPDNRNNNNGCRVVVGAPVSAP